MVTGNGSESHDDGNPQSASPVNQKEKGVVYCIVNGNGKDKMSHADVNKLPQLACLTDVNKLPQLAGHADITSCHSWPVWGGCL